MSLVRLDFATLLLQRRVDAFIISNMANVKDFGAKGDGKTNDTEALQHAVNEIDGVLELPRGDYLIRQPIVVPLQRTGFAGIRGDQGTARILMHGPGPAIHVVGNHQGTATP